MKLWVYLFLTVFITDFIYRTFIKNKFNSNIQIKNDLYKEINEINSFQINKSKFNSFHSKSKLGILPKHFYNINTKSKININEEIEDFKEESEDDIEFGSVMPKMKPRINITIEYDKIYQKLFDELSTQIKGNFTYLCFYPKIISQNFNKKIIKIFLYCSLGISALFFIFIEKIFDFCCKNKFEKLKSLLSAIKFILIGSVYLFYIYFIKKCSYSNIFEVYINKELRYSTIKKQVPPSYIILSNILRNLENEE